MNIVIIAIGLIAALLWTTADKWANDPYEKD